MNLTARAYTLGRAIVASAPAALRRRVVSLRRFSMPTTVFHLPEQGVLYIKIGKVGTGSVLAALGAFAAGERVVDERWAAENLRESIRLHQKGAFAPEIRRLSRGCFTFTFVRNPLDRLLSAFSHQKGVRRDEARTIFLRHRIPFDVSFADFVRAVARIPDEGADSHIRSQHTFIYDSRGPLADFVGRFETLSEDWAELMDRFGFPPLPRRHVSVHSHFREAYTPELARIVAHRYERDIELFGYEEDVAALAG